METTQNLDNYKQTIYGKIAFGILITFLLLGVHPYLFYREVPGEGLIPVTNNITWITVSLFILFSSLHMVKRKKFINNQGVNILLLILIPMIIPLYYGNSELLADGALRVLAAALGVIVTMLVTQLQFSKKTWLIIFSCLLVSVVGESLFGLYQHYLAPAGQHVMSKNSNVNVAYGSFSQYNVMGIFVATGIASAIMILILLDAIEKNTSTLQKKMSTNYVLLTLTSSFLATWVLILCLSRTAYLALTIIMIFAFAACFKGKMRSRYSLYFFSAVFIAIIIGVFDITTSTELFRSSEKLLESSGGGRTAIWSITVNLFLDNPIWGVGYGNYWTNYIHQNAFHYANNLLYFFSPVSHPHNEILYWAVEGGIIPLLGITIGICTFLFYAIKKHRSNLIYFTPLIPLSIHSQLELVFYSFASMWVLFCVILAFICQKVFSSATKNINLAIARTINISTIFLTILFAFALSLNLQAHYHYVTYVADHNRNNLKHIIWQGAYEHRITTSILVTDAQRALRARNKERLKQFVIWAEYNSKTDPREIVYKLHYQALLSLGRTEEAKRVYEEGKYLFPIGKMFKEDEY